VRTATAALAAVALTIGLAAPVAAHPQIPVTPPIGVDLTHEATDNVGFVARFHEHFGNAGGIKASNDWNDGAEFYVVTDPRGVFTYDIANPEAPELLDFLLLDQGTGGDGGGTGAALAQEDPSTDGRTLLVDGTDTDGNSGMHIVSIEDPTNISILGVYGGTDHTWTCVTDIASGNGCAYAYGRDDNIIDIRDPANPVKLDTGWKTATGESGYAHDLTEIRPGLVMHAGAEPVLMDTTDPANPVKISHITLWDHASPNDDLHQPMRSWSVYGYHSVEWANDGTDDFLVMGTEITPNNAGDDCSADEAVIETWDARPVKAAFAEMERLQAEEGLSHEEARQAAFGDGDEVKFVRLDSYQASGVGTFTTGQAAGNVLYCAHWMEPNPSWDDGGTLVAGYYNRGARFIDVDSDGMMTERGWFTGADAYTGSAQWINDEVVYVMDYVRGMDIIKLTDGESTGTYTGTGSVHERAMTIAEMESIGIARPAEESAPYGVLTVAGMVLLAGAFLRRRHLATTEA